MTRVLGRERAQRQRRIRALGLLHVRQKFGDPHDRQSASLQELALDLIGEFGGPDLARHVRDPQLLRRRPTGVRREELDEILSSFGSAVRVQTQRQDAQEPMCAGDLQSIRREPGLEAVREGDQRRPDIDELRHVQRQQLMDETIVDRHRVDLRRGVPDVRILADLVRFEGTERDLEGARGIRTGAGFGEQNPRGTRVVAAQSEGQVEHRFASGARIAERFDRLQHLGPGLDHHLDRNGVVALIEHPVVLGELVVGQDGTHELDPLLTLEELLGFVQQRVRRQAVLSGEGVVAVRIVIVRPALRAPQVQLKRFGLRPGTRQHARHAAHLGRILGIDRTLESVDHAEHIRRDQIGVLIQHREQHDLVLARRTTFLQAGQDLLQGLGLAVTGQVAGQQAFVERSLQPVDLVGRAGTQEALELLETEVMTRQDHVRVGRRFVLGLRCIFWRFHVGRGRVHRRVVLGRLLRDHGLDPLLQTATFARHDTGSGRRLGLGLLGLVLLLVLAVLVGRPLHPVHRRRSAVVHEGVGIVRLDALGELTPVAAEVLLGVRRLLLGDGLLDLDELGLRLAGVGPHEEARRHDHRTAAAGGDPQGRDCSFLGLVLPGDLGCHRLGRFVTQSCASLEGLLGMVEFAPQFVQILVAPADAHLLGLVGAQPLEHRHLVEVASLIRIGGQSTLQELLGIGVRSERPFQRVQLNLRIPRELREGQVDLAQQFGGAVLFHAGRK